jgi:hypothetical protein
MTYVGEVGELVFSQNFFLISWAERFISTLVSFEMLQC